MATLKVSCIFTPRLWTSGDDQLSKTAIWNLEMPWADCRIRTPIGIGEIALIE